MHEAGVGHGIECQDYNIYDDLLLILTFVQTSR